MSEIPVLRTLHVLGAVLLLGNVIVTGLWAALLWRERAGIAYRRVARVILWADLAFTVLGGTLLTMTGIMLVIGGSYDWRATPWIVHGILALGVGTAIWLGVLVPDQFRMARWNDDDPRYAGTFRRWTIVGWGTTLLLLFGLWAMVSKS
jgi:uncharacterized membrane protein